MHIFAYFNGFKYFNAYLMKFLEKCISFCNLSSNFDFGRSLLLLKIIKFSKVIFELKKKYDDLL